MSLSTIPLLCADAVAAQNAEQRPSVDDRGEAAGTGVTETGNRVVYASRYFGRYNVVTARDMLERIPGIRDLLNGGGGQRGFGNSGDQVLINGRRLSGKSIDIGSTVDRIQARQVDRIEVIRGTVEGLDVRSRGRVVNLVLTEALTTGFGSWESSWSHYSDGRGVPGAEVNYSGHLGALNYVLSSAVEKRLGRNVGNDLFYTPENALFERQAELNVDESDEYSFTANTTFSRRNGDILNLNTLYSKEDDKERRRSERFRISGDDESYERDVLIVGEDATVEWEIGGDYEHILGNGNVLTGLFVVTARDGEEESAFELTPAGEQRVLDELQLEDWHRSERILRGTYAWGASDRGSWESGAEVALNAVDRAIELFEDIDGDGSLEETLLFNQASEVEETRVEAFTTYSWQAGDDLLVESSLDLEASELTQSGGDVHRSRDFFFARPRIVLRYDATSRTQLRARVERSVSQLDFSAFTASFVNDDNRLDVISAGNPELVPEKSWDYELTYERRLNNDAGFVSMTGTFRDIEDVQARVPLLVRTPSGDIEERTAPGNIGDATEIELEVNASLRLGWLALENAVLETTVAVTETDVTDPFTGEDRELDFASPYEWELRFRHDTSWNGLAYGFEVGRRGPDERFDLDYHETGEQDAELELFAELSPLANLTLRLELDEVLRAESERERHQYVGNRGDGILARRELRLFKPVRELTLSVQGTF